MVNKRSNSENGKDKLVLHEQHFERDLTYLRFVGTVIRKVRMLAYSNEVAESFRYSLPFLIKPLYVVSFGYIAFDIGHGIMINLHKANKIIFYSAFDSIFFHSFASILLPSVFIHKAVGISKKLFNKYKFSSKIAIRGPILIGLGLIPLIIHPIDHSVEYLMDNYLRPQYPFEYEEHKHK